MCNSRALFTQKKAKTYEDQVRVVVTGAGGFIGHHLTKYLINRGYWVRGVDIKEPEYEPTCAHEFELLDLTKWENCLAAARQSGVKRYFYTSSACVYPGFKQNETDVTPLKEEDAYPADAEDGYGWEKLYMERVCRHYTEDFGLDTRGGALP
jgi:GDP-D-mannose 3',5'-epimerase